METYLRPLTLGEILDRTAQLYRSNFWLFAGISAVYAGVLLVLSLAHIGLQELFRIEHLTRQIPWLNGIAIFVQWLFVFLFGGLAVAANNRAVASVHMGEGATIRGAYASILPRAGRYLWLMTIMAFVLWLPLFLLYCGYIAIVFLYLRPHGALATPHTAGAPMTPAAQRATVMFGLVTLAFGLLLLVAVAYAVVMGLRYALAVAASVVEDLKARQALRRSISLSQGSRGRIFVLGLLVFVIQFGLVLITQSFFIALAFKQRGELSAGVRVLQQVIGFLTNSFIGPIYATGLTLFYYDQRIRKEGYDIEWMMQAAGMSAHLPPQTGLASHETANANPGRAADGRSEMAGLEADSPSPPSPAGAHDVSNANES